MRTISLSVLALAGLALVARETTFPTLKSTAHLGKQDAGFFLVPTNQMLRPWGQQTVIPGRPVDMAYDSHKRVLAVLDTRSVVFLDGSTGAKLADIPARTTSYAGIAWRPGDGEVWASETSSRNDSILVVKMSPLGMPDGTSRIELKGHPVPTGIAFSSDGKTAYVALSRDNSLAVIDAEAHTLRKTVDVGMAPFGVAVSKLRGKIYVTNRGGRRPGVDDITAPSSGSPILTDAKTGSSVSGTLSIVDAETLAVKDVPIGLAPSQLTLSGDEKQLAAVNSHSDTVSIVDTETLARSDIKIPTFPEAAIGAQPTADLFSADGKTLYIACGGNNAIAVLSRNGKKWRTAGALPTLWFPTAIALDSEGALRVLDVKGSGNTDNHKGSFNSRQYEGALERISKPEPMQLAAGAREVRAANMPVYESAGGVADLSSLGIEHVFLIVKENRAYDQVFGDIGKGNSDPKLAMYGRDVTPNHHALAERYVLLDNFYTGGAISFDGHQWLEQGFVSDYTERAFAASPRGYAWNMADALTVAPTGFFWQSATRPFDVRIYGEFQNPAVWDPKTQSVIDITEHQQATWSAYWQAWKEGKWETMVGSRSGVPALQPYCDERYPNSTTAVPDQIRAEEFLRDLHEHEQRGRLQNLTVLTLNEDHTNGTRPGSPTPKAMVADDDLALGRIVEGISKSSFWAKSLILVVEDDAQDGVDHVDGHRTVALAIGPRVRRDAVDSNNYNHGSLIRTIQDVFRIPPRTRFLKAARAMNSIFTAEADTAPYEHLVPKQRLDEMNPPLKALNGRRLWAAKESAAMDFTELDDVPEDTLNHILWWDAKGYDTPYPSRRH